MTVTALITGGTSGIGQAVANKLAQLGIHVMVVGRSEERGKKTITEIHGTGGQADFIASDLRDASSVREVAGRAVELGSGHVDILINNAGVYPFGPTQEMTEGQFDQVYVRLSGQNGRVGARSKRRIPSARLLDLDGPGAGFMDFKPTPGQIAAFSEIRQAAPSLAAS